MVEQIAGQRLTLVLTAAFIAAIALFISITADVMTLSQLLL